MVNYVVNLCGAQLAGFLLHREDKSRRIAVKALGFQNDDLGVPYNDRMLAVAMNKPRNETVPRLAETRQLVTIRTSRD